MGLNREQRRALARQAIEGEDVDVQDVDSVDVTAPKDPGVPAVAAPIAAGIDPQTIAQIVAATVAAMQQGSVQTADSIAQALRDNRQPIAENTDAEYHARSHWHPGGKDASRPALTLRTYRGAWDHEERKASPMFEYDASQLRDDEIETLNALAPGEYSVERKDGVMTKLYVVDQRDANGEPFRRILAFPRQLQQKEHRNQVPDLKSLRRQLMPVA